MKIVNIYAAKTGLSRLLEESLAGEDIVIAKAGHPLVRLVPVAAAGPERKPGRLKGKIHIGADFDAPLPDDLAKAFGER